VLPALCISYVLYINNIFRAAWETTPHWPGSFCSIFPAGVPGGRSLSLVVESGNPEQCSNGFSYSESVLINQSPRSQDRELGLVSVGVTKPKRRSALPQKVTPPLG
jgi:hypothetical protein